MTRMTIILLIVILAGCDRFQKVAYSIGGAATYKTSGEIKNLCNQLEKIAKENSLTKKKDSRPETQCYFSDEEHYTVVLGARVLEQHLVIDIQSFNSPAEFDKIQTQLLHMLSKNYSGKYLEVREHFKPWVSTLVMPNKWFKSFATLTGTG